MASHSTSQGLAYSRTLFHKIGPSDGDRFGVSHYTATISRVHRRSPWPHEHSAEETRLRRLQDYYWWLYSIIIAYSSAFEADHDRSVPMENQIWMYRCEATAIWCWVRPQAIEASGVVAHEVNELWVILGRMWVRHPVHRTGNANSAHCK